MKILLDTSFVLWAAEGNVPRKAKPYFEDTENELYFSAASIWEIVIKKPVCAFLPEPSVLRAGLLDNGYAELPITSRHTLLVQDLPPIHKDPFDRILIAQAKADGLLFLTADKTLRKYDAPILYCPKNGLLR